MLGEACEQQFRLAAKLSRTDHQSNSLSRCPGSPIHPLNLPKRLRHQLMKRFLSAAVEDIIRLVKILEFHGAMFVSGRKSVPNLLYQGIPEPVSLSLPQL